MVADAAASMDTAGAVPAIALQTYASPLSDCVMLHQQAHTSTKPRTSIPELGCLLGLYLQQLLQLPSHVEAFHQTELAETLAKATTTAIFVNPASAAVSTETVVQLQTTVLHQYVKALSEYVMMPLPHVEAFRQTEPAETFTKATTTAGYVKPANAVADSETVVRLQTTVRHRYVRALSEHVILPLPHAEAFHQTEPAETLVKATTTAGYARPVSAVASTAIAVLQTATARLHWVVSQLLVAAQAWFLLPTQHPRQRVHRAPPRLYCWEATSRRQRRVLPQPPAHPALHRTPRVLPRAHPTPVAAQDHRSVSLPCRPTTELRYFQQFPI